MEPKLYLITWVTYKSRRSKRLLRRYLHIDGGIWLEKKDEVIITKYLMDIAIEDSLDVYQYNICGDHVHIILKTTRRHLPNIIRKLKGKSSQQYKTYLNINPDEKFHLWAQKFHSKVLDNERKFQNIIRYVENNRKKHNLPPCEEIEKMTRKMQQTNGL